MITTTMQEKGHQGRAVKRLRELLQVKQETIASALNISQQSVSLLETKETLEPEQLELIAQTLRVPVDTIKNFNEEATVYNIQNNYDGATHNKVNEVAVANNCTINSFERWLELLEENKKLNAALLKEKDEKIALLERILAEK